MTKNRIDSNESCCWVGKLLLQRPWLTRLHSEQRQAQRRHARLRFDGSVEVSRAVASRHRWWPLRQKLSKAAKALERPIEAVEWKQLRLQRPAFERLLVWKRLRRRTVPVRAVFLDPAPTWPAVANSMRGRGGEFSLWDTEVVAQEPCRFPESTEDWLGIGGCDEPQMP